MSRSMGLAGMMMLALISGPANAFDIVDHDYGGRVDPYLARLATAQARGEVVRFGPVECDSSCTLFLAAPRSCVSANTVFGFHAPWTGTPRGGYVDPRMTAVFAQAYKPALRRAFLAHVRATGHMTPGPLMRLTGLQLASLGYRLCG